MKRRKFGLLSINERFWRKNLVENAQVINEARHKNQASFLPDENFHEKIKNLSQPDQTNKHEKF